MIHPPVTNGKENCVTGRGRERRWIFQMLPRCLDVKITNYNQAPKRDIKSFTLLSKLQTTLNHQIPWFPGFSTQLSPRMQQSYGKKATLMQMTIM